MNDKKRKKNYGTSQVRCTAKSHLLPEGHPPSKECPKCIKERKEPKK